MKKIFKGKRKAAAMVAAIVVVLGAGYMYYVRASLPATAPRFVTQRAATASLTSTVVVSGTVEADSQESVNPTISGTVADIAVAVGDAVKKGQTLFTVVNNDLDVQVAQSAASYQQAVNALASARNERAAAEAEYRVARNKDKDNDDAYTKRQLAVLEERIALADNAIVLAQKSLTAAGLSYRTTTSDARKRSVTSPIDGTVMSIAVNNGDELGSSPSGEADAAAMIIGNMETLQAKVQVNEVDIATVAVGQTVSLTLDALADTTLNGTVKNIDAIGTAVSGVVTYGVTIGFDTLDERMRPGMSVAATITTSHKDQVLTVPTAALKTDGATSYVTVLRDGVPQRMDVVTGAHDTTSTEIVSGLAVGDEIVVRTVSDGAPDGVTKSNNQPGGGGMGIMGGGMGGPPPGAAPRN